MKLDSDWQFAKMLLISIKSFPRMGPGKWIAFPDVAMVVQVMEEK